MGISYHENVGVYFHLFKTNKTFNYSTHALTSAIFKNLESNILIYPRNLTQAVLPMHIFFLRDGGQLYSCPISNTSSGAYKIDSVPETMEKLKACVFVDDSYSNLEFAKQLGMTTIRVYYRNNSAKGMEFIDSAYKGIEETVKGLKEDYNC